MRIQILLHCVGASQRVICFIMIMISSSLAVPCNPFRFRYMSLSIRYMGIELGMCYKVSARNLLCLSGRSLCPVCACLRPAGTFRRRTGACRSRTGTRCCRTGACCRRVNRSHYLVCFLRGCFSGLLGFCCALLSLTGISANLIDQPINNGRRSRYNRVGILTDDNVDRGCIRLPLESVSHKPDLQF